LVENKSCNMFAGFCINSPRLGRKQILQYVCRILY
jgi:hypothetical protein